MRRWAEEVWRDGGTRRAGGTGGVGGCSRLRQRRRRGTRSAVEREATERFVIRRDPDPLRRAPLLFHAGITIAAARPEEPRICPSAVQIEPQPAVRRWKGVATETLFRRRRRLADRFQRAGSRTVADTGPIECPSDRASWERGRGRGDGNCDRPCPVGRRRDVFRGRFGRVRAFQARPRWWHLNRCGCHGWSGQHSFVGRDAREPLENVRSLVMSVSDELATWEGRISSGGKLRGESGAGEISFRSLLLAGD